MMQSSSYSFSYERKLKIDISKNLGSICISVLSYVRTVENTAIGGIHVVKSRGQKTDLCGTPCSTETVNEV